MAPYRNLAGFNKIYFLLVESRAEKNALIYKGQEIGIKYLYP
jgi:hypothetical protein